MSAGVPSRSETELTVEEHRGLEQAFAELRDAVEAYEDFLGAELPLGEGLPIVKLDDMRAAQERVEAAEAQLWELRERILGWARPPWAPPATLVSDWILEDDPGYDDGTDAARR